MLDFLKNTFVNRNRYKTDSEAVIIACFFNPQNNPYRLLAFQKWYHSIKHLNHRIYECLIGPNAVSQLPKSLYIRQLRTDSLLWHKEALLNKIVKELPEEFRYVFWLDTDVLFTNKSWLVDATRELRNGSALIQPFEYGIHLKKNEIKPSYEVDPVVRISAFLKNKDLDYKKEVWRSFAANYVLDIRNGTALHSNDDYDIHGHVGFAWGARREVLEACPLYDHALIGGADHIIAHAAVGQLHHPCIVNAFKENIQEVQAWSERFYQAVRGRVSYIPGELYHLWHGDIKDRQYLKRIKEFSDAKNIVEKDKNGLYTNKDKAAYVRRYYQDREVYEYDGIGFDDGFFEDMGYALADVISLFGQPYSSYDDSVPNAGSSDPSDSQQNDQLPFSMGGAGVTDNGQHIITDDELGATQSDFQPKCDITIQPSAWEQDAQDQDQDSGNFS